MEKNLMWKRKAVSLLCILTIIGTFIGGDIINKTNKVVFAEEYREGYALVPQKQDSTGIDTTTTFILKSSNENLTVDQVMKELSIEPQVNFTASVVDSGVLITLEKELKEDHIYTFRFGNVYWTFQTSSSFKILGALPSNESTNVPTNTGIEIYFSHEEANIEQYFEIEPKVEGSFERHGKVVVFMPKELQPKTIYTITLKEGLPLKDSNQRLEEDYTYSFETRSGEEEKIVDGYFSFNKLLYEFSTKEKPKLFFNYGIGNEQQDEFIQTNVYAFESIDQFTNEVKQFLDTPIWASYAIQSNKMDVSTLDKVLSFATPIGKGYESTLDFPSELPAGYYLVTSQWMDIEFQTLIEITDISFYAMKGNDSTLLWLNDLESNQPIKNAKIQQMGSKSIGTSDENGIVTLSNQQEDKSQIYTITSGEESAVYLSFDPWGYYHNKDLYWKYFGTDRNLYQPDDEVQFWGFIKNRGDESTINEVSIEITESSWWWMDRIVPFGQQELSYVKTTVPVDKGIYKGALALPNLEPSSYQVKVKYQDELILTQYIEVENYVKPAYKIEVESDHKAIFVDDQVEFTTKTSFFEGTPVAHLPVQYNINGINYLNGQQTTDDSGEFTITYESKYEQGRQGIMETYFSAYTNLPESGEIYGNESVKVFINDVFVDLQTTIEEEKGDIEVQVNNIVLDRLNNETAQDHYDFLGDPVDQHELTGTIYKNKWVKTEVGEYYDYINKVVRKQYEYHLETTDFQEVTLTTDEDGYASTKITLPQEENVYYSLKISTNDLKGRSMKFEQYFSKNWYRPSNGEWYHLQTDKEQYNLDETIEVSFMNNDKVVSDKGNYLFIMAQNGVQDYVTSDISQFTTSFSKEKIPNVTIYGVYFNGKTYVEASQATPRFNYDSNKIELKATTNQANYQPGDTVVVNFEATTTSEKDNKRIPVPDVFVNISIVDEALFSLSDQKVDVLEELYRWVPSGVLSTYGSHYNRDYQRWIDYAVTTDSAEEVSMDMGKGASVEDSNGNVRIRSEFKDTAYFETIVLNEDGKGTVSFVLPDNITAWRMTFAGISNSLQAGTNVEEVLVTLPFFINHNVNETYLVGDKPSLGITTYGQQLKNGEEITIEVECEATGFTSKNVVKAFKQINIPLWKLKEGNYELVIKAKTKSGLVDAIKTNIQVVPTYHMIEIAESYIASKDLVMETTDQGMTDLIILDQGKGKLLPKLYELAYTSGNRIDQKNVSTLAQRLLKDSFKVDSFKEDDNSIIEYKNEDGLLRILPYAEGDLETTIKMLPLAYQEMNTAKLSLYLQSLMIEKDKINPIILYGLALLDEPVLMETMKLEQVDNLNLKDQIYVALTYAELGDVYQASKVYEKHIQQYVTAYENIAYVKSGDSEDDYLELTALLMLLASKLNLEQKNEFYQYVASHYSNELLANAELLQFIQQEIDSLESESVRIAYKYDGETYEKTIDNGWPVTLTIPSGKIDDFHVVEVEGDAAIVAVYEDYLVDQSKQDEDLSVRREYYNYFTGEKVKEFQQSDLVKVVLDWDIEETAIDDVYRITDYTPSGLIPVNNVWDMGLKTDDYYYRDIDGQKITFYVSKHNKEKRELYYYARVVSTGTYQAEGTIIQGTRTKDSMNVGDEQQITIK